MIKVILIIPSHRIRQIQTLRSVDNSKSTKPEISPSQFNPWHAGYF